MLSAPFYYVSRSMKRSPSAIEGLRCVCTAILLVLHGGAAAAGQSGDIASYLPAPQAPEVVVRDNDGRATIRAQRITTPLRIDGRLDEEVFARLKPISGFYQVEPVTPDGRLEADQTDVWLLFDDRNIYFVARCWDGNPERIISNDQRRDSSGVVGGDHVGFILDTFYDRRNGVIINIGAGGGRRDGLVTDETQFNVDWNGIFDSATGRFEKGWTAEVAVPFKTLRYTPGPEQVWSFNVHRGHTRRNEKSFLMPMKGLNGGGALMRLSMAATVVGIEAPPPARNLDVKPFVVGTMTGLTQPRKSTTLDGDAGVDVKYGITSNLTADFTYNTDFAQVEVDEQQINLTRFSLFFPEKREFFLENAGLFAFAGATGAGSSIPVLFYSRRIGLDRGAVVPIRGGGRVTGSVGKFSLGAMSIHTGDNAASASVPTTFSVMRMKRRVLRRSNVGAIVTHRSVAAGGSGSNQAYGVDGTFPFFTNLAINTYWARTHTEGIREGETSYRAAVEYVADRYGAQFDHLVVGQGFNPEIGFVNRGDIRRDYGLLRFSPRPAGTTSIRKLSWIASYDRIAKTTGRLETRTARAEFDTDLRNGDSFNAMYQDNYEYLPAAFRIATGVTIPVGGYQARYVRGSYSFGQQRMVSGTAFVERGSFYDGTRTTTGVSGSRVSLTSRFSISPAVSVNRVKLPYGDFTSRLVTTRVVYTMTPLMFTSALVQYNSSTNTVSANVRLRWEYRPGSEMFVVYNEERDSRTPGFPSFQNRAFIVKVNRLVRF
jgi:hypothetical protein